MPTPSSTSSRTNSLMRLQSCSPRIVPAVAGPRLPPGDSRTLARPAARRAPVWPGRHQPLGVDLVAGGDELRGLLARGHRGVGLPVRRRRRRDPAPADRAHARHLARRLPGVAVGQRYGFRVDGPWDPDHGRRFNPAKLLLDPYARAVTGELDPDPALFGYDAGDPHGRASDVDSAPYVPRSVVVHDEFDWGGDAPAAAPVARHGHLRAARQGLHRAARPGARAAARDVRRARRAAPSPTTSATSASPRSSCCRCTSSSPSRRVAERGLANYWGYNSIGFFAPHAAYSSAGDRGQQVTEFKQMVKAFHDAGHRGDPRRRLQPHRRGRRRRADAVLPRPRRPRSTTSGRAGRRAVRRPYWDVTGCGNTVDAAHPSRCG